jgi:hypothetical protein
MLDKVSIALYISQSQSAVMLPNMKGEVDMRMLLVGSDPFNEWCLDLFNHFLGMCRTCKPRQGKNSLEIFYLLNFQDVLITFLCLLIDLFNHILFSFFNIMLKTYTEPRRFTIMI